MIPVATLAMVIMLLWRIVSYYVYLIVGITLVPLWLRNKKK